jgi:hypothetical protein
MVEKKKSDVVDRLLARIDSDPELKARLEAKVNLEFSVINTIHGYLRGREEFNQSHLEEFGEYCIKETLKRGGYIPSTILYYDWLEYEEKEDARLKEELK